MFHKMHTGDLVFLITIMALAAAAFILPPLRTAEFGAGAPKFSAVLFAIPLSALAMAAGAIVGKPSPQPILDAVAGLHE